MHVATVLLLALTVALLPFSIDALKRVEMPEVLSAALASLSLQFLRVPYSAELISNLAYAVGAASIIAVINVVYVLCVGTTVSTSSALRALSSASSASSAAAFIGGLTLYGYATGTFAREYAPAAARDCAAAGFFVAFGRMLAPGPSGIHLSSRLSSMAPLVATAASYLIAKQLLSMRAAAAAPPAYFTFPLTPSHLQVGLAPNFFAFLIVVVTSFVVRMHFRPKQHAHRHWEQGLLKAVVGTVAGLSYALAISLVNLDSLACAVTFLVFAGSLCVAALHTLALAVEGSPQHPLLARGGPSLSAILARVGDGHPRPTLLSLVGAVAVGAGIALNNKGPFVLTQAITSSSAGLGGLNTVLGAVVGTCVGVAVLSV